jgi:hypothetical protein
MSQGDAVCYRTTLLKDDGVRRRQLGLRTTRV